jgi:hypothetical protein
MQPWVLSLSCLIQILQISQDNVRKVEVPIALSEAYARVLIISRGLRTSINYKQRIKHVCLL